MKLKFGDRKPSPLLEFVSGRMTPSVGGLPFCLRHNELRTLRRLSTANRLGRRLG